MNINIYQIYYLKEQEALLDNAFVPFNNITPPYGNEVSNLLREWPIVRKYGFEKAMTDNSDVWGFTSYKFFEKTGVHGSQYIDFIKQNPNNDVWFMEPVYYPINPFFNPWTQGEVHHPLLCEIMNYIFAKSGNAIDIRKAVMPFCWYNFFAGNKKFWALYFKAIDRLFELSKEDAGLRRVLFDIPAGHGNDPTVPYFIFVVERLFPTIIASLDLKSVGLKYSHPDFIFG